VLLKAALRREEELRTCAAQQDLFSQVEHRRDIDWLDLAEVLQENVVREFFGTTFTLDVLDATDSHDLLQNALGVLRTAAQRYPDDLEFRSIPLYVRYNRTRAGTLVAGDRVLDVHLVPLIPMVPMPTLSDGGGGAVTQLIPIDFWQAMFPETTPSTNKPLLIIASSWT